MPYNSYSSSSSTSIGAKRRQSILRRVLVSSQRRCQMRISGLFGASLHTLSSLFLRSSSLSTSFSLPYLILISPSTSKEKCCSSRVFVLAKLVQTNRFIRLTKESWRQNLLVLNSQPSLEQTKAPLE
jgi:hypothetical protein